MEVKLYASNAERRDCGGVPMVFEDLMPFYGERLVFATLGGLKEVMNRVADRLLIEARGKFRDGFTLSAYPVKNGTRKIRGFDTAKRNGELCVRRFI